MRNRGRDEGRDRGREQLLISTISRNLKANSKNICLIIQRFMGSIHGKSRRLKSHTTVPLNDFRIVYHSSLAIYFIT
jgi:hypothetical protein